MKQPAAQTTVSTQPPPPSTQSANSSPLLNPSSVAATTRRSQYKKHTPTTLSSNSDLTNIDPVTTIKSTNLLSANNALSPTKSGGSHSLTRLYKSYPYRFKSLTSQSSNALDNEPDINEVRISPAPSTKNLAAISTLVPNTNLLSPRTSYVSLSNSNNNLLSTDSRHLHTNQQAMLKQMQKKYSKSVDSTYCDSTNLTDGKPSMSNVT